MKTVIAGVAMGLVKEGDKTAVLTDIQGIEDFLGDMDFKVTGDEKGITALQMDIKIKGLDIKTLTKAIDDAREGRLFILGKMKETLPTPRPELNKWAPRIETLHIGPDTIGAVIGPGGKMIRSIIEQTGATIDIEDDGTVRIGTNDGEMMKKTIKIILGIAILLIAAGIFSFIASNWQYLGKAAKLFIILFNNFSCGFFNIFCIEYFISYF